MVRFYLIIIFLIIKCQSSLWGYSNGMLGYLPTTKDLLEGGYEVDKSRKNFGIDSRISVENEKIIKKKIF